MQFFMPAEERAARHAVRRIREMLDSGEIDPVRARKEVATISEYARSFAPGELPPEFWADCCYVMLRLLVRLVETSSVAADPLVELVTRASR